VIAVKGYENWSGRAIMALQALQLCSTLLRDYEIVVYTPDVACSRYVASIGRRELRITVLPRTSHQDILALFGRSRIYLGVSLSDGISTSMLEAMAMGAFPIQTCTSCADEWFEDGRGGFIVRPQVEEIAGRLRQALEDDILVDLAAASNWKICEERLDSRKIGQIVRDQYDSILAVSRASAADASRLEGP
jgi:glycosyltransferase involved in cell wall biosynthesis